jgi:hypothetical protein
MEARRQPARPHPSPLVRGIVFFLLIIAIFFCIEILPLCWGQRLPWPQVLAELKSRLPRILLIAAAAGALSLFQKTGGEEKSADGP